MRLVLTGAGGFLGTELLRQLAPQEDVEVLAVSSKADAPGASGFPEHRIAVVAPGDFLADPDLMMGFDILLNCAFPRNVDGDALGRGLDFISALFCAAAPRVKAVINISSQSVYSQHRAEPATEETPVCLESAYAAAKYATELMLKETCSEKPHTNIRLASLIGPGFNQRVVNKMVAKAFDEGVIEVMDNGSLLGYFDVRDAASGIIALIRNEDPASWAEVYNLGPSFGYSLPQIAHCVKKIAEGTYGKEVRIMHTQPKRESCAVFSLVDASLFRGAFQWASMYTMEDTVKAIASEMTDE